jgi:pimeloyl-ACP methyl ester carboxylesterase
VNPANTLPVLALTLGLVGGSLASPVLAAVDDSLPAAIYADPAHDSQFPANVVVLHIPSHGSVINGLAYIPSGRGPHGVLVLCHGLPGNEKNLDLAQAVRRAGWVAVTFNYRGSWGSPGRFSFRGNLDDAAAVLAYLREPRNAQRLRGDPKRIALVGHSMGGWVAAQTAATDREVIGTLLISAWDPTVPTTHKALVADMADDMESLAGVTPESMAMQVESLPKSLGLSQAAGGLKERPLLVLTADDGLQPAGEALIQAIKAQGGNQASISHVATDHSWSDRRIDLESRTILWLQALH